MQSTTSGFFTTLLMFVPVVAVPALAIFGVPSGEPLKASLEADVAPSLESEPDLSLGASSRPRESVAPESELGDGFLPRSDANLGGSEWDDPFSSEPTAPPRKKNPRTASRDDEEPFGNPPATEATESANEFSRSRAALDGAPSRARSTPLGRAANTGAEREQEFGSPSDSLDRTEPDARATSPERRGPSAVRPRFPDSEESDPPATTAPATGSWQAAAARLKEFGIRDFQLQPGDSDQQFVFLCRYASPRNPRVVRQFEAESDDPLKAVQDVLSQVEAWANHR